MSESSAPIAKMHQWRLRHLMLAPHRLAFFMAAVMLSTSALWWAGVLLARVFAWRLQPVVAEPLLHALLMSLSFMPLFFCGFLFTAGPKWLKLAGVRARSLLPALLTMLTGWALDFVGMYWQRQAVALGVGLVALGWSALALRFTRMVRASRVTDKFHTTLVGVACWIGVAVIAGAALALALDATALLRTVFYLGIWWFLAPVFAVVSHRMIPFFSANLIERLDAWRPNWVLAVMLATLWFEGLASLADLWWWPLPQALRWLQVSVEAPAALLMLGLALRWGLIQSLKIRLLAMLHGGFVWLGLALALNAVSHALMAASGDTVSLGLAPMHAMTMGYLGCTMFAMVTRVSSGHGGRKESADNTAWALYWVLQIAVVLRVGAAIFAPWAQPLTLAAMACWSVAMLGWALRYGHWFGTPRPDGQQG
ncbi:MAG: hypothetical protein AUJ20_10375 [Comamonadaceae bacterium CG1_02_60_18]|nr:MAG: hypothetical protein AUJ20_10375 [Comamonadaceae bacterium CG1_02_60_18]